MAHNLQKAKLIPIKTTQKKTSTIDS